MAKLDSLCIYCGSRDRVDPAYRQAANDLGRLLGENRIRLVYGGGRIGLMGIAADAALTAGGEVTGIIPYHLHDVEVGHKGVTELIVTESMHARKEKMFDLSDAFAVLPGGLGTLDETFEILTWRQLKLHDKPVIIVNCGGYWTPFFDMAEHIIQSGFADRSILDHFIVVEDVADIIPTIRAAPEAHVSAPTEIM
jgi:uncharacterized protein (TIGR00730 family)